MSFTSQNTSVLDRVTCNQKHLCPCCGTCLSEWGTIHTINARKGLCPVCGTFERQRAVCYDFIVAPPKSLTKKGAAVAYFGPHIEHTKLLRSATPAMHLQEFDYFAQGYRNSPTTVHADVQDIPLSDESFDGIIILHVLEHVPNLDKAISEMSRVIKSGGFIHHETPCYYDLDSLTESPLKNGLKPPSNFFGEVQDCEKYRKEDRKGICRQHDHLFGYTCNYLKKAFENHKFDCSYPDITQDIADRYGVVPQINRFRCIKKWNDSLNFKKLYWTQLHEKAQEAAKLLGFDESLWDNDSTVPIFSMPFESLGAEMKSAVNYLGLESYFEEARQNQE